MKSSKSGDEGSAQANNKLKTSKSGDEGSAQANNKLKTSKSGDEGSAQAPSNTTNKGASEKTKTSTTNTGEEPAPKEPVSSNDNTKLISSDQEAFLLRVGGGRAHRKRQQVSPGVSKGTDIVSGDTVIGDEGLVKTTSRKHKSAKSGVSPSETVKNSQPVTNKASAEQSSPPPPPPPPETESRNNAKLVNKKRVMQATPVRNVKQAQKRKTTVEHEPLPAKKGKSKVKAGPKDESLANKKQKVKAKDDSLASVEVSSQSETEVGSVGSSVCIFCTKCDEIFGTVDELVSHEKQCYKGRRYPCTWPGCKHTNSQKSLLRQHVKGVHENNPYRCSVCREETFVYKKSHDKHVKRYHTGNKTEFKYKCPECDFASDDKTEFTVHLDRHQNVKRFKCNLCAQAFFSQSQLTGHMKNSCVTVGDDRFECSVCGKKAKTEDRYREHFYSQHVENQGRDWFYCEICISRFMTPRGLEIHTCKTNLK